MKRVHKSANTLAEDYKRIPSNTFENFKLY